MDKIEEMLEREQAEGTGYGIPSEAYAEEEWEQQKVKGWPRQIHVFGLRQNQINLGTAARLRALEIQNRTLEIKIQRLEEELGSGCLHHKPMTIRSPHILPARKISALCHSSVVCVCLQSAPELFGTLLRK